MKITAYFSHPIRGKKGSAATKSDMELNNEMASTVAKMLSDACPALELYVPADNDEFVLEGYLKGKLVEETILDIDCTILRKRDILIAFCHQGVTSSGMQREIREAMGCDIPVFTFEKPDEILFLIAQILDWYHGKHES
jgi:hypothetical protein